MRIFAGKFLKIFFAKILLKILFAKGLLKYLKNVVAKNISSSIYFALIVCCQKTEQNKNR